MTLFYANGFKNGASSQNAVVCPEKTLFSEDFQLVNEVTV